MNAGKAPGTDTDRFRHRHGDGRVDTEAIRRQHPISEIVAAYGIELRRAGAAMVGRCPFHQDRGRPNLHVYRSGRWICYRCDQRGDVIGFVQQMENLTFREAVDRLGAGGPRHPAAKRGHPIDLASVRPTDPTPTWGRAESAVLAAAMELYVNQLRTNSRALAYMEGRGFPQELLEQHHVGFVSGDALVTYLRWRRLSVGAAVRTGLLTGDGREFLAGRVVFPELRQGQPVWMIGRTLDAADAQTTIVEPKYLGLPGSKPLLGWEVAVRDTRAVCLVEGPTDLLALRLWGVPGLALTGTAIRADVLQLLRRFRRIYLALDNDAGGHEGADRIIAHLGECAVRLALPSGINDVADLARLPRGEEVFRAALLRAVGANASVESDIAAVA
jgi:DNA primase